MGISETRTSLFRRAKAAAEIGVATALCAAACAGAHDDYAPGLTTVEPPPLAVDVWNAPAVPGAATAPETCAYPFARLDVTRIKQDSAWLYVELRHAPAAYAGHPSSVELPTVERVASDGSTSEVSGAVGSLAPATAGWLAIPRVLLPAGEFELKLGAFGRKTTVPLVIASNAVAVQSTVSRQDLTWNGDSVIVEIGDSALVEVK